jgi:hypothetical protein
MRRYLGESLAALATVAAWLLVVGSEASAATLMRTQAPCAVNTHCVTFPFEGAIPLVRTFFFDAPSRGVAQVFFHGSLFCDSGPAASNVVLDGQIVTNTGTVPNASGPGGQRYAISLGAASRSDTFGLTATRDFVIPAAGRHNYYFKLVRIQMHEGSRCWVYNAAFSLIFVN